MSLEPEDNGVPTSADFRPLEELAAREARIDEQDTTIEALRNEVAALRRSLPNTDTLRNVARTAGRVAMSPIGMTAIAVAVGGIIATQFMDRDQSWTDRAKSKLRDLT